jgi:hypothetical protein
MIDIHHPGMFSTPSTSDNDLKVVKLHAMTFAAAEGNRD